MRNSLHKKSGSWIFTKWIGLSDFNDRNESDVSTLTELLVLNLKPKFNTLASIAHLWNALITEWYLWLFSCGLDNEVGDYRESAWATL